MRSACTLIARTLATAFTLAGAAACAHAQEPARKPTAKQSANKTPSPAEELQTAISEAGNDRSALVKNLQGYLEKYPSAPERPQIYRALVEACVQFKDDACATNYAERIVALTPEDTSMTLVAIQLLERAGDREGMRRAVNYATRVYNSILDTPISEKSHRVSLEEWESQKHRDESAVLALRGRLESKLGDNAAARTDYEASYSTVANAGAALKLGELEELSKNYEAAAARYAQAYALSDAATKSASRKEIRQKLGNAWRLARGSDAGLGDFLLKAMDDATTTAGAGPTRARKNEGVKDPLAFVLRSAPEGASVELGKEKGKVVVVNFWATWCGPCHALEPIYDRIARNYAATGDVTFLSANCDEDESLVGPYLQDHKSHARQVFADGLEESFGVGSFPTILILDRNGKMVFRANGFDPSTIEGELSGAIQKALLHTAGN
jgi:thiol-disulfide isomerase/thioredoxin